MIHKLKKHEHKVIKISLVIIVALVILYFIFPSNKVPEAVSSEQTISATYDCSDGKSIKAEFSGQIVNLAFSDGRNLVLDHAVSADGARYSNPDESIVFWNVGDTATVTEGNKTTYQDCIDTSAKN